MLDSEAELTVDGNPEFIGALRRDTSRLVVLESSVVLPERLADPEKELPFFSSTSAAAVKVRVKYCSSSVAHTDIIIFDCM